MTDPLELVSANRSFGGWVRRYRHTSEALDCAMTFGIYLPPQAEDRAVPLLWWLSGLTCTDENFMQKAGAQRVASELGLAIICPDTSPRGTDLPGEHDRYDLGSGAGFYLNAARPPWDRHYRMYDYVTGELPALVHREFPLTGAQSISGHSMGGHGALVCALHNTNAYRAVSAFAPIANPADCPWGRQAFAAYLGEDGAAWRQWDASALIREYGSPHALLVDQGAADEFYHAGQLRPHALESACAEAGVELTLRYHPGYDHSYYFVATLIEEHLRYHACFLE